MVDGVGMGWEAAREGARKGGREGEIKGGEMVCWWLEV